MNPASLATLASGIPGYRSITTRIYAPHGPAGWFLRLNSKERGDVIAAAKQHAEV